jgi:hypothetical protein
MEVAIMLFRKALFPLGFLGVFALCVTTSAMAKVSAEEAARLGKDLTPIGAEKAGNADGTIPEWVGAYKATTTGTSQSGKFYADPFKDDKVLFTITAQNMDQYAEKLSNGQMALLKKYPESYKMDVYQTRRTIGFPQWYYDNTKKNATRSYLTEDRLGTKDAFGGTPFPIPQYGEEVMANKAVRYGGAEYVSNGLAAGIVYPDGKFIVAGGAKAIFVNAYSDKTSSIEKFQTEGKELSQFQMYIFNDPARRKGEFMVARAPLNASEEDVRVWTYLPGQRRVRRAPNVAYDTPNPSTGGLSFYDEGNLFIGELDRFDWKIVGKKELYIPYNNHQTDHLPVSDVLTPYHVNPDYMRWELHRVWMIEATVKEGKRHAYSKRHFYLDEDSWETNLADNYDKRGELWRTGVLGSYCAYELPAVAARIKVFYDLQKEEYGVDAARLDEDATLIQSDTITFPQGFFTAEEIRRQGRR